MKIGVDYVGIGCGCIVLNKKNEILLVKRANDSRIDAGMWSRPGGSIEFGETAEESIKREVKEEVDLDIDEVEFLNYFDWIKEEDGVKKHWLGLSFVAVVKSGKAKNLEKGMHDEIGWFPLNDLPENITAYTKNTIDEFQKKMDKTLEGK